MPREAEQQCAVRDANEAIALLHGALASGPPHFSLRCECGDPACLACVWLTHTEYEDVRGYGSHFAVSINHENPENACVLSATPRFAVIDVMTGDSRYAVLARNARHTWVEDTTTSNL
jgi:hypothetical protein